MRLHASECLRLFGHRPGHSLGLYTHAAARARRLGRSVAITGGRQRQPVSRAASAVAPAVRVGEAAGGPVFRYTEYSARTVEAPFDGLAGRRTKLLGGVSLGVTLAVHAALGRLRAITGGASSALHAGRTHVAQHQNLMHVPKKHVVNIFVVVILLVCTIVLV
jgi:hypothetical protein